MSIILLKGYLRAFSTAATLYLITFAVTFLFLFIGEKLSVGNSSYFYEIIDISCLVVILIILYISYKNKKVITNDDFIKKKIRKSQIFQLIIMLFIFRVFIDPVFWTNEIFNSIKIPLVDSYIDDNSNYYWKFILSLLSSVILIPIIEEIVFRGIIIKYLKENSKLKKVIFSSILFALIHMPASINYLLIIFFLGIILCQIALNIGLIYSILFHSTYNFVALLLDNNINTYRNILRILDFNYIYWIVVFFSLIFFIVIFKKIGLTKI